MIEVKGLLFLGGSGLLGAILVDMGASTFLLMVFFLI